MDNSKTSVLIVGIDSQIGSRLSEFLMEKGLDVYGTTRDKNKTNDKTFFLDLSSSTFILPKRNFSVAIICAAITSIKECEENPIECKQINVYSTIYVIDELAINGSHVIFLSSNAVFSGEKSFYHHLDQPDPSTNYGRFKLVVEEHIKCNNKNAAILRLTKVITHTIPFIKQWEKDLGAKKEVFAYTNVFFSPITIDKVLDALKIIIEKRRVGVFHLGGQCEVSYFDYAKQQFANDRKKLSFIKGKKSTGGTLYNSLTTYLG